MKLINPYIGYREPVYKNLFVAEFEVPDAVLVGSGITDANKALSVACYKFSLPTVSFDTTTLDYINYKVNYVTSNYNLGEITTGFYNFNIGNQSARHIFYQWGLYMLNWQTGQKGYTGSPTIDGQGYKTKLYVYELNPDGVSVMTAYLMLGAFPTNPVPANEKDWSSKGDVDKIDITWKCDTFYKVNVTKTGEEAPFDWTSIRPDE